MTTLYIFAVKGEGLGSRVIKFFTRVTLADIAYSPLLSQVR
jgi:hypothetical protein